MKFATYSPSGEIEQYGRFPDDELTFFQGIYTTAVFFSDEIDVSNETHYVDLTGAEPVLAERVALTGTWSATTLAADGVAEVTFGPGIPMNTIVRVNPAQTPFNQGVAADLSVEVDDGTFEFSTTVPGIYRVTIENPFPYLTHTQDITAT